MIRFPNIMVVNPSVPVHDVAEFIAYAKANPENVNICRRAAAARPMSPANCSK